MSKEIQIFAHYAISEDAVIVAIRLSGEGQELRRARIHVDMGTREGGVGEFLNIVSQINGLVLVPVDDRDKSPGR